MGYIENLRKVIGNQPLILVGAVVAVIDDNGRILLQKKTNGVWNIPGGLLELEESTEEAARREVFEETGIKIGELELVNVYSGKQFFNKLANGDEFYPVTIAYLSRDIQGGELKADGIETLEAAFFHLNELPQKVSPLVNKLVQHYNEMVS